MFLDPFFSGIGLIFTILGLIIAVLWSLLPFAVFGIKQRLDKIIEELEKLNLKTATLEKEVSFKNNQESTVETIVDEPETDKKESNDNSRFMPKGQ